MWNKMAIGALSGLVIGHFVEPGYALWLIVGVVSAYVAEVWAGKALKKERRRIEV